MRYNMTRKYPITKRRKENSCEHPERIVDLSLGVAAGLLGLVFIEGVFWGYMIRKWRR